MTLESGTRFGSYEVVEAIGAGGMGEVYRAHDTTLERDVAIKVLPASFAEDAGRVERFEREAKTLASLNHPNIAQIYGLEKSNGTTALVMELVDGATLEERIAKEPIPADEALGIAMQIADALEAAHGQNIVHRDLKPANIKLKPDGTVKVLDFGIAKALAPENLVTGPQSPILTTPATQVGVILGTAAYMSPEQARGKPVDQRTDIWAFGCVLYEMLTGQLAFGGEDVALTLARVLDRDTDVSSLPAAVSPAVRHAIKLCLEKDPRNRLADIRDVRLALKGALETEFPHSLGRDARIRAPIWKRIIPVAAAVVVTGVIVGVGVWIGTRSDPRPVNRFDYELPEGRAFREGTNRSLIALAPDGRHFVYNASDGLYLRAMGELEARLIAGTEGPLAVPVYSPDGQAVAYFQPPGQLKRIAITGGAPVVIADDVANPRGMSWEADGTIFFGQPEGIMRVSANGGPPEVVIPADDGLFLYGPRLLPGGDTLIFSVARGAAGVNQIVAQSLTSGERKVLIEGGSEARYVPTGHLVYALGDGLFAVAFDADSLTVSGGAVPLVQGVRRTELSALPASYEVANDGTLVYAVGSEAGAARTLVWVDRQGREVGIAAPPRTYTSARISPDGSKVALDVRDQDLDIWIWDLVRETLTRLTFDPGEDEFPEWSPDGRRIAFSTNRDSGVNSVTSLFWQAADGTGSAERLVEGSGQLFPRSFLPDATGIVVFGQGPGTDDNIRLFEFDGGDRVAPLLETAFEESYPALSPDGRWLAYTSNASGAEEVYVRPFPDIEAGRWQVSTGGGTQPVWARDGGELFYRSGAAVVAVPVETEPSFNQGNPEILFEGNYFLGNGGPNYDVSPDGERFLMIKQVESAAALSQIIIVENWFTELERLVPTE